MTRFGTIRKLGEGKKGQVLVVVALLIFVFLGVASLALDLGRAYGVKARLNAAVDAASYEAAKALAQGSDESSMIRNAREVASDFFNANYPAGYLGATPHTLEISPARGSDGLWTVNVSAKAQMPTLVAGVLGWGNLEIGATSESQRKTVDMALVLDTSESLKDDIAAVREQSIAYVDMFNNLDDRVALVPFSSAAYPVVSICGNSPNTVQNPMAWSASCERGFDKRTVENAIGELSAGGMTASEEGMKKALDQLNSLRPDQRARQRVIVFFSDGAPNTFNGTFVFNPGGTVQGNLFSGFQGPPQKVFDATVYRRSGGEGGSAGLSFSGHVSGPLQSDGTDSNGKVPFKSHNSKRFLSGEDAKFGCDANKAARNMVENVAESARSQGITIYTLGLGAKLGSAEYLESSCETSSETGTAVLNRLANTKDSDSYNPSQPIGIYCHAETVDQLKPCFDRIASSILRISK